MHRGFMRGENFSSAVVAALASPVSPHASMHRRAEKDLKIEGRVGGLAAPFHTIKLLRNRFIGTLRRVNLASATEADRRVIREGNAWVYGHRCLGFREAVTIDLPPRLCKGSMGAVLNNSNRNRGRPAQSTSKARVTEKVIWLGTRRK